MAPIVAVDIGRCRLAGRQDEGLSSRLIRTAADDAQASGDLVRASYLYMTMQRGHARHAGA